MSIIFPDIVTDRLKLVVLTLDEAEDIIRFHLEDTGCRWGIFSKTDAKLIGTRGFYCGVLTLFNSSLENMV
ncbi:hypothetical protein [Paenibacillus sp. P13VS]|uniref:hypothetical protein n=1 Tax=Paenibacillus sp. P13VS TaxID=2697367 RepID=UPI00187BAAAF|nr:hypothetical protein [Paenibacillus sp. P13VS]